MGVGLVAVAGIMAGRVDAISQDELRGYFSRNGYNLVSRAFPLGISFGLGLSLAFEEREEDMLHFMRERQNQSHNMRDNIYSRTPNPVTNTVTGSSPFSAGGCF